MADDPRAFTHEALPGRVVFAAGSSRRQLAAEIERLGTGRLLLIAAPARAARSLVVVDSAPWGK